MNQGVRRHFATVGVHPYDQVAWERRDARITNHLDGSVAFEHQPLAHLPGIRADKRINPCSEFVHLDNSA